jgi:4-hydroxybenzoate polyprenyltransferase
MTRKGLVEILRLPLFITAVADVAAGYVVALLPGDIALFNWRIVGLLAGTATGLYLFGMVENDLVDIRRDRFLKVPRPLVTGQISVATAVVLLVLAGGLAAVCGSQLQGAALVMAIAAFGTINLYNLGAKRGPAYIAMTVMGLCRVLNFMVGVTAAAGTPWGVHTGLGLLLPSGPLWAKQALALFAITAVITGYSIMFRRRYAASTRVWQVVFVASAVAGSAMIALFGTTHIFSCPAGERITPPMARVAALLLLAVLWPGGLWSKAGPKREPAQYSVFIERAIYWMILMDAAFVIDALIAGNVL